MMNPVQCQEALRMVEEISAMDLACESLDALESSQAEAQRIVAAAHEEARQIFQKGYADGRAAGYEEGVRQAAESLAQVQGRWEAALEDWETQRHNLLLEGEQSLLGLALTIARKIVHRLPGIDSSVVVAQVEAAVEQVVDGLNAAIHIHPGDRPIVEQCLPRIARRLQRGAGVSLVEDPAVEPGGCIVVCGASRIDATLDKQIERMAELLIPDRSRELEAA